MLKPILLWCLSLFLLGDSILRMIRTNWNLGAALMYLITAAVWVYTLFYKQIDAFCAHGIGLVLKIIFLCGCAFLVAMIIFIAVRAGTDQPNGDERAVIVLGAGLRGDRVSGVLARRLNAAHAYYLEHPDVLLVVTGGQGFQEIIPEADAMRKYLLDLGVPDRQILVEDKSTSTEENFAFARALLEQRGISAEMPIAFSTNNFHCYRSAQYAKEAGFMDVDAIPASTGLESIASCYLREVFAVLYYWVFKR